MSNCGRVLAPLEQLVLSSEVHQPLLYLLCSSEEASARLHVPGDLELVQGYAITTAFSDAFVQDYLNKILAEGL